MAETPDGLEGLGGAAWWQNDAPTVFDARERAYRLYRSSGDRIGAARVACALALDSVVFRGEEAVANGWLQRAGSLLDETEPGPEHALLALTEGALAVVLRSDTVAARRVAAEALSTGRRLGIADIEMLALALEGLVLVSEGAVEEGTRRLDAGAPASSSSCRSAGPTTWPC